MTIKEYKSYQEALDDAFLAEEIDLEEYDRKELALEKEFHEK